MTVTVSVAPVAAPEILTVSVLVVALKVARPVAPLLSDRFANNVAPALQVHPATDTLLKYTSPKIDVTLLGVDENWRQGVRVIFRKKRSA